MSKDLLCLNASLRRIRDETQKALISISTCTTYSLNSTSPRSDLGVHIDGFIAVLAHTTVIQAADAPAIGGVLGNLLAAADCATKVCHRQIKVGAKVFLHR